MAARMFVSSGEYCLQLFDVDVDVVGGDDGDVDDVDDDDIFD